MENVCNNCKYFIQHYIKKDIKYHPIGGHCINDKSPAAQKRKIINICGSCSFWESNSAKKAKREEKIKLTLVEMQESLKQIALILQDDES